MCVDDYIIYLITSHDSSYSLVQYTTNIKVSDNPYSQREPTLSIFFISLSYSYYSRVL